MSTTTTSAIRSPTTPVSFSHILQNHDKNKVALIDGDKQYTYGQVNHRIDRFATELLALSCRRTTEDPLVANHLGLQDLQEERVALFLAASLDYMTAMHGVWRAGGMVVPLHVAIVPTEIKYYLTCAGVRRVVSNTHCLPREWSLPALCQELDIELILVEQVLAHNHDDDSPVLLPTTAIDSNRRAMILFTSGTTSKPKGVVTTHKTICAQITTLVTAWAWTPDDVIPLFLPLHHIHGIINALSCALWAGAAVHVFTKFHVQQICEKVAEKSYTVFMAVPTIYVKILQYLDTLNDDSSDKDPSDSSQIQMQKSSSICDGFRAMRLNVSGSTACPVSLFQKWQKYTGQTLLERYGMTEIGMALSNPYHGQRRAGCVGQPLPGVQVQLFHYDAEEQSSLQNQPITETDVPGEIRIKGDNVFLEYWNDPEATRASFKDEWFCTGDIAVLKSDCRYYKILGRSSIDIIKSGGYKLSALEIEGVLLTHPQIAEVAVIGVPDDTWGQVVMAFCCLSKANTIDDNALILEYDDLKAWCKDKMSSYKIPKQIKVLDALPRNAMGKVTKPLLNKMV
mmetsp:Transcript_10904/g.22299  ORF Transcript_10904/g.22299 Transcript_10904/m.22299 type:complete len:567 (-) Transcript_10904:364-2064(-)